MSCTRDLSKSSVSRRELLRAGAVAIMAPALNGFCRAGEPGLDDALSDGYIDAHVHVWTSDTQQYPLDTQYRKDQMNPPHFTPEDLFTHTRPCNVTRVVLIQMSYYGTANTYLLDVIRAHRGVFSGVAVIDSEKRPRETMLELAQEGVRGFRIAPGELPADRWLDDDAMATMWRCGAEHALAMCPLMDPQYLPAVDRMCRRFPDTPVVIDHFARVGIDGQFRQTDLDNLCGLARHKNVYVKVSAFSALGRKQAPYLDLAPMIRRVWDAYGCQRLMWATDSPWQVMGGHTYRDSIDLVRTRLDFLTDQDRQWLLRKTAERVFFA